MIIRFIRQTYRWLQFGVSIPDALHMAYFSTMNYRRAASKARYTRSAVDAGAHCRCAD